MSTKPSSLKRLLSFLTCSNSGDYCIWLSTATRSPATSDGVVTITGSSSLESERPSTSQTSSRSSSESPSSSKSTHSAFSELQTLFSSQMTSSTQSQLDTSVEINSKLAQQSLGAFIAATVTTKSQSDTPPLSNTPVKSLPTQYSTIIVTVTVNTLRESYSNTVSLDPAPKEPSNRESFSVISKVSFSRYMETTPFFSTEPTPTTHRYITSHQSGGIISTTKHSSTSSTSAVVTPSINATEPSTHTSKSSVVSKAIPISLSIAFIIGVLLAFAFRRYRTRNGRHPTSKQSIHSSLTSFFPPQYPPPLPPPPRPPRQEAPESPTMLSYKTGLNSYSAIELAAVGGRRSGSRNGADSVPMKNLSQPTMERSDQSVSKARNSSELSGSTMIDNRRPSPQNVALDQGHMYPHYDKRSHPQRIQEVPKYIASETTTARDEQQLQSGAKSYDQTRTPFFGSHTPPISMAPLPLQITKLASISRSSGTSSDGNAVPPRASLSNRPYIPSQSPRPSTPQRADHRLNADSISPVRPSLEHVARERFHALNALEGLHEEENRAGDYSPSLYSEDGAGETVSDLELLRAERVRGDRPSARAHENHFKSGGGWI